MRSVALSLILALPGFASADAVDDIVAKWMKAEPIPGVSVAIYRDGKPLKESAYGLAELDHRTKASAQTRFELASVSKPYTATALMMLVEEGKVDLDAPVRTYVPSVPDSWQEVTVRRLLNHTVGWPFQTFNLTKLSAARPLRYSVADQIADVSKMPLPANPGSKFSYTNFGYTLLGAIIKSVSGKPYSEFIRERILQPNGLSETDFVDVEAVRPHRAAQYTKRGDGLAIWSLQRLLQAVDDPAYGGMEASARDVARFAQAFHAGRLLKPANVRAMLTPSRTSQGETLNIGLGWFLGKLEGRDTMNHTGYSGTVVTTFLDDGLTVVVLTNLGNGYPAPFGRDAGFPIGQMGNEIAVAAAKRWPKR